MTAKLKIDVEISDSEIAKLQADLFLFNKQLGRNFKHRVTGRFGKRTAGKIIKDGISEDHTIKKSRIIDKVTAKHTGRGLSSGLSVRARSRFRGAEDFRTKPTRTAPSRRIGDMTATYTKGKPTKYEKVFSGRNRQRNRHYFYQRKEKNKLWRVYGPSLKDMYGRSRAKINKDMADGWTREAIKAVEYTKQRRRKI